MPRRCKVCEHAQLQKIDKLLLGGDTFRSVARAFGLSEPSVGRHYHRHLGQTVIESNKRNDPKRGDKLLDQIKSIIDRAMDLLERADNKSDFASCAKLMREARESIRLLAVSEYGNGAFQENAVANSVVICIPHNGRDPLPPGYAPPLLLQRDGPVLVEQSADVDTVQPDSCET
jgi:hypothetical protein